ncbi:hypothetical protein VHEMI03212 [[Torrubiella] hemipterigena]|uniref:Aminoglycoside phosphotransferase domain-containing protein n=1 Tax=[Torrubiella] hemipterigena TaxID=1531966 RepID=A0A0A1TA90_9HYPO|nr:hypothetical protein VHEMI03212 [[Torrubiella] hemipterigena]
MSEQYTSLSELKDFDTLIKDLGETRREQSNDVIYVFTETTFTKISRLPIYDPYPDGTPFTWWRSWNHERIDNEAKALKLIAAQTTIPVPQLLAHGTLSDGCKYLTTARVGGISLSDIMESEGCLKPLGQQHMDTAPCKICSDEAHTNATLFINETVLPQLANLKSRERGIDGFVMPPSWICPDAEPPWDRPRTWKTIPLEQPGYIFQHGDMAAHNILIDRSSLQVNALIDWEHAGYFPSGMERWPGTLHMDDYRKRGRGIGRAIEEFLAEDYIECYNKWADKAELENLVRAGELPDITSVRNRLDME